MGLGVQDLLCSYFLCPFFHKLNYLGIKDPVTWRRDVV